VAKKLNLQFMLLCLRYMWGLVGKHHIVGGGGWNRHNSVIWRRGSKIAQKTALWYLKVPLGFWIS